MSESRFVRADASDPAWRSDLDDARDDDDDGPGLTMMLVVAQQCTSKSGRRS